MTEGNNSEGLHSGEAANGGCEDPLAYDDILMTIEQNKNTALYDTNRNNLDPNTLLRTPKQTGTPLTIIKNSHDDDFNDLLHP